MESAIMKISADAYEGALFAVKPAIKAIHAGLECGLFLSKYPELDMVSFVLDNDRRTLARRAAPDPYSRQILEASCISS